MSLLETEIKYIKGVGPMRASLLARELEVTTAEGLLQCFPTRYVDRSKFYTVSELRGAMSYIQLRGTLRDYQTLGEGRGKRVVATFSDATGTIELVWFKGGNYVSDKYPAGSEVVVFGRPSVFNGKVNIAHPEIDPPPASYATPRPLQPIYRITERMKSAAFGSRQLQTIIVQFLAQIGRQLPETLPPALRQRLGLMEINEAYWQVHRPTSPDEAEAARYRFKFEEFFYLQLNILYRSQHRKRRSQSLPFPSVGDRFMTFYNEHLPFELTEAQKRVVREIRQDCCSGRQMSRLLQGDVGSGKTMVALLVMLLAADNGYQTALMAPTEILASQHYASITAMLGDMPVRVELLTGSTRKKARTTIHEGLRSGEVNLLIGTHALIEDEVQFARLGLIIIDEQHRFGVAQRARLQKHAAIPPHVLVMTATPIPRTLAMTLYGDLDVSVIDQLPPGRKPIRTIHLLDSRREGLLRSIVQQIDQGRQVYIVYPLIKESERADYKDLEAGYEQMVDAFPQYNIEMVHGKMKPAEKEEHMQRFVSGEAKILMATTVIEVGVNVPNASVMVIENAERFGLSQLHQLRGRVGRGASQSFCVLVTKDQISDDSRRRIEVMTSTNDGFEIAEADLKMRGAGDIEGTQQSGVPLELRIADLVADSQLLQFARQTAEELLDLDPDLSHPTHQMLLRRLRHLYNHSVVWGEIG